MPDNLLTNGGFEGTFRAIGGQASVSVAEGWQPFFMPHGEGDPDWKNRLPEWKAAAPHENRIHGGTNAQQWFNFYGTNDLAGVYQMVSVAAGDRLHASAWVQMWSASHDDAVSGGPQGTGNLRVKIGIDRAGGNNQLSGDIVWSEPVTVYDAWQLVEIEATALTGQVTLFVASMSEFAVKHNDCYVDDVALYVVDEGEPPEEGDGIEGALRTMAQRLEAEAAELVRLADALKRADDVADELAELL